MDPEQLLETKIRAWFKMTDVRKDGCMSVDDFTLIANRFVEQYQLNPDKSTEIRDWLAQGWDKVLHDKDANPKVLEKEMPLVVEVNRKLQAGKKITEDEFTHAFIQLRNKNYPVAKRNLEAMISVFFDLYDANHDGYIVMSEMEVAMACFGMQHPELVQKTFQCMDKKAEGKLSRDVYIENWVDFFFGEEPDNPLLRCFAAFMNPPATA